MYVIKDLDDNSYIVKTYGRHIYANDDIKNAKIYKTEKEAYRIASRYNDFNFIIVKL